jgi:hypothetical protein
VDGANAAEGNAVVAFTDFVMDVGGRESSAAPSQRRSVFQAAFNAALALSYLGIHLKSFLAGQKKSLQLFKHRGKSKGFRVLSISSTSEATALCLFND